MGQQKYFRDELRRIMGSTTAKDWKKRLTEARKRGGSVEPKYWEMLYNEVELALRNAKELAESQMSNAEDLALRAYESEYNKTNQQLGQPNQFPLVNR